MVALAIALVLFYFTEPVLEELYDVDIGQVKRVGSVIVYNDVWAAEDLIKAMDNVMVM